MRTASVWRAQALAAALVGLCAAPPAWPDDQPTLQEAEDALEFARAQAGPELLSGLASILRAAPKCKSLAQQCEIEAARRRPPGAARPDPLVMTTIELQDGSKLKGELVSADSLGVRILALSGSEWSLEPQQVPRNLIKRQVDEPPLLGPAARAVRSAQFKGLVEVALVAGEPVPVVERLGRWRQAAPDECDKFAAEKGEFRRALAALAELCPPCGGTRSVACSACGGKGKRPGEVECPQARCKGEGTFDCKRCQSVGAIECTGCGGDGTVMKQTGSARRGPFREPRFSPVRCGKCKGTGRQTCVECNGKGNLKCEKCDGRGRVTGDVACSACDGAGKSGCPACGETGRRAGARAP